MGSAPAIADGLPPRGYRSFFGLPWRWWRHLPHWHIAIFEAGRIQCAICWRDWDEVS